MPSDAVHLDPADAGYGMVIDLPTEPKGDYDKDFWRHAGKRK